MVEWEARIKGDVRALSELSGELDNDVSTIEKREEEYFLKSEQFEGKEEFEEVNNIAEDLIDTLSGIASIHLRTEIDPELYVHDVIRIKNGERKSHAFVKAEPAEMRLFAGKPDLDKWVELSQENKEVEELLNLVQKGLDWRNLYAIYEFIQDDIGGNIYEQNWGISKSKINRFTATANSRKILGDEARHGADVSNHSNPMSHGKAKSLIERICKKWLDSKTEQDTSGHPSLSAN
jgi:hypothetical protein